MHTLHTVVEGSSDDLDQPIKIILCDEEFAAKHHLFSLNSINWGRILMQTIHFVFTYFFAKNGNGNCEEEEVEIAVPTGAAGNITGRFSLTLLLIQSKITTYEQNGG